MNGVYYEKVMVGKKTTYREVQAKVFREPPKQEEFDNAQLVTLGASLGMMVLMQMEKQLPEKSRNARKLAAVSAAILDLVRGSGQKVSEEMCNYWADSWNRTMREMQSELTPEAIPERKAA